MEVFNLAKYEKRINKVAIYIRYVEDSQYKYNAIEQLRICSKYNDVNTVIYNDNDYATFINGRKSLQDLCSDIKRGKFTLLVTASICRISRLGKQLKQFWSLLEESDTNIVIVDNDIDTRVPELKQKLKKYIYSLDDCEYINEMNISDITK